MIMKHKLIMDLERRDGGKQIDVMQDDKYSRELELELKVNGKDYCPPEDCVVLVRYQGKGGHGGAYDTLPNGEKAWAIQGNRLTVALAPQVCDQPGEVMVTVTLRQGCAELSCFSVRLNVHKGPGTYPLSREFYRVSGFIPQPDRAAEGEFLKVVSVDDRGNVTATTGTAREGKSAYQYAIEGGYAGTEEDFSRKLAQESGGSGIHIGSEAPEDDAVDVWIDTREESPEPEVIQPDWNAQEGEPGHVLNRTHWEENIGRKVFVDTTLPPSAFGNGFGILDIDGKLQEGQTYTVTFAGQQYSCVCRYSMIQGMPAYCLGNTVVFGGEATEEPFGVFQVHSFEMAALLPLVQADEYAIKIEGDAKTYHTIRSKFLPKPIWLIDFELGELEDNGTVAIDVPQLELNRAIDNGELVALRGLRRSINNPTVAMYYFYNRYQDWRIEFAQTGIDYLMLTPNANGTYDLGYSN